MFKRILPLLASLLLLIGQPLFAAPLDINSASASTLATTIHGVGQKRAEAIVAYRDEHGPFKSIDELTNIRGISVNIIDSNRELITAIIPTAAAETPAAAAPAATAAAPAN